MLREFGAKLVAKRPFYRTFPYAGGMDIFKADPRGAYSPTEDFFYNRVPKAANSTIVTFLTEHSKYKRRFASKDPKDFFLRPSYLSAAQVARIAGDAFKFTVVREPYARVLSAYSDKIGGKRHQSAKFFAWAASKNEGHDFASFCRFLDDGNLFHDIHWAPQTSFMLIPLDRFDLVGKVETLADDLRVIGKRAFGLDDAGIGGMRVNSTGSSDRLADSYTDEAVEIVTRLYARDFVDLGYKSR